MKGKRKEATIDLDEFFIREKPQTSKLEVGATLLNKVRNGALTQRDVKNEESSG